MTHSLRSFLTALAILASAGSALAQLPPPPPGSPEGRPNLPLKRPPAGGRLAPSAAEGSPTAGDGPATAVQAGLPPAFDKVLQALGPDASQSIGRDLGEAVRGVSLYPERTRSAILLLASYSTSQPKLIGDLAALRTGSPGALDKYLVSHNYPAELQNAAAIVLVEAPDTIDRMAERPELVAAVGQAYQNPAAKQLIDAALAAAHEQQSQAHMASVDGWAERLKADPALMQQYLQMLNDHAQQAQSSSDAAAADGSQTGGTSSDAAGVAVVGSYDPYGYGTTATDSGYSVSDVPSEDAINYALAYGYKYDKVANSLVDQYLTEENLDDYQQAVGDWYSKYGDSVPAAEYAAHRDYYESLNELSAFDDAVASSSGGRADAAARRAYLEKNPAQYKHLASRLDRAPQAGPATNRPGPGNTPGVGNRPGSPLGGPGAGPIAGGNKGPIGPGPGGRSGPLGPGPGGSGGKPPFAGGPGKAPGAGAPPGGSGSQPFSSLLSGTPKAGRPPQTPKISGGPFGAGGGKPPAASGAGPGKMPFNLGNGGPPMNVSRGTPAPGNQLARAQSFHGAAWGGPKMGGTPGGARPGGAPGGGMKPGGGPRPGGGPKPGGPRPG